jgi:hypothetical protein
VTIEKQSHAVRSIATRAKRDLKESSVSSRGRGQNFPAAICDNRGRVTLLTGIRLVRNILILGVCILLRV